MMQENIADPSCKLNDPQVRIVWSYIAQYARRDLEVVQEKLKLNLSTEFVKLLLDDILKFYTDLNKANELKELLPEIFQSTSKEEAEKLWSAWYKLASESNVEEIT